MRKNKRVAEMAQEVLERQARERAERTGEPFEDALRAVLKTDAGRQLQDLRHGQHAEEEAKRWQERLPRERIEERHRGQGKAE
jgi:hypothetical protein